MGIKKDSWSNFFGEKNLGFALSAGTILWPIVFIMTDVINEYYGMKGVRFLSFMTVGLIGYALLMVFWTIGLEPAGFWSTSHFSNLEGEEKIKMMSEVGNYNSAFKLIFGQGLWIIIGSLVAFLIGQLIDVFVFHKIKQKTGDKLLWLRATGSTVISQLIDSFVVLFIAFYAYSTKKKISTKNNFVYLVWVFYVFILDNINSAIVRFYNFFFPHI